MIVGYEIVGQDNGSHMYNYDDHNLHICKKCNYVLNFDYLNSQFIVKRRQYDFSYTYDGRCIVSLRFKEFCLRNNYKGLVFFDLKSDKDFFYFKTLNIIKINTKKQEITKENYCEECGRFEGIVTGRPLYLNGNNQLLDDNFYSTDIQFGGGNGKASSIIVGIETANKLKKEKLKGIVYIESKI